MLHPRFAFLAFAPLLALACGSSPAASTTTSTSGAGGGSGGAGGSGGGEGFLCPATGVSKGPWSLAIDGKSAKIRWEACRKDSVPQVIFAPEKGGASVKVDAVETPFEVTETFTAPLSPDAPPDFAGTYYMHEAALDKLAPSTCYAYSLGADPAAKGRFCTARNPGEDFTFLAIGDTNPGLGPYAHDVLQHTLVKNPDFVIHGGDIQYYASGLETWASWFPVMQPMLSQGGIFPAIGNHESEKPSEYEEYEQRFFGAAGFDGKDGYYRFQSGGVWFFCINTEVSLDEGSPQALWFEQQLEDASKQPGFRFSVVYFHRPWVSCGDVSEDTATRLRFEPLFAQYKVTLIFQAHMHGYERFELGAFTYVTTGGGGGRIVEPHQNPDRPECADLKLWGGFRHAVVVDVKAGMLTGTVIDDQGMVQDTFSKAVP
ncbi:MAG: metallophosphoesterase [Minicystis sp.]